MNILSFETLAWYVCTALFRRPPITRGQNQNRDSINCATHSATCVVVRRNLKMHNNACEYAYYTHTYTYIHPYTRSLALYAAMQHSEIRIAHSTVRV